MIQGIRVLSGWQCAAWIIGAQEADCVFISILSARNESLANLCDLCCLKGVQLVINSTVLCPWAVPGRAAGVPWIDKGICAAPPSYCIEHQTSGLWGAGIVTSQVDNASSPSDGEAQHWNTNWWVAVYVRYLRIRGCWAQGF